jgi:hypothetical protein
MSKLSNLPKHGSAEDRGSADRYYGRTYNPHHYAGDTYSSKRIETNQLTMKDHKLYKKGWEDQTDRKDWG